MQSITVGIHSEASEGAVSPPLSDMAHVRQHDADGRRVADVGRAVMGYKGWTMITRVYGKWIKDA